MKKTAEKGINKASEVVVKKAGDKIVKKAGDKIGNILRKRLSGRSERGAKRPSEAGRPSRSIYMQWLNNLLSKL